MRNIDYYDNNSRSFYDRTINVDLSDNYEKFLSNLQAGAHVLDAGCGVGRDTKYFLSRGYKITSVDASEKMVELAAIETNAQIIHTTFQELNFCDIFDGVWAQASLLHVPYEETREIYNKIKDSLKAKGIFYASYKYGTSFMPTEERDFYNMTEETIVPYLDNLFDIVEIWTKNDRTSKVAPSPAGLWLNFIARKK